MYYNKADYFLKSYTVIYSFQRCDYRTFFLRWVPKPGLSTVAG